MLEVMDTIECSLLPVIRSPRQINDMSACTRTASLALVVKASVSGAEDPGFESRLRRDFFNRSSHTSDLKIGTPVATLPSAWHYRVSAGTGRLCVRIL